MDRKRLPAAEFVTQLAARGRYNFTNDEAVRALGVSVAATGAALRRLKRRGEVADPHRGFHVIVPPECRRLGCPPAEQFIHQLMEFLGEPYYVALLSAAEQHSAAHQRPQALQVMVSAGAERHVLPAQCNQLRFPALLDVARQIVDGR